MQPFVVVDADNTLWDTNAVYADAQLKLLSDVEEFVGAEAPGDRLAYLRAIDQDLAVHHPERLRYPVRLLAQALARALDRGTGVRAVAETIGGHLGTLDDATALRFEAAFVEALKLPPRLRSGVQQGLQRLASIDARMVVFTEGRIERVRRHLTALELDRFFEEVIEVIKNERTFAALIEKAPDRALAFVIGDQLDSDIRPAKAAGFETIYFPGGFAPKWAPDADAIGPHHRVDNFTDAASIVINRTARG